MSFGDYVELTSLAVPALCGTPVLVRVCVFVYFVMCRVKKAILESEGRWAQNVKLVDTRGKGFIRIHHHDNTTNHNGTVLTISLLQVFREVFLLISPTFTSSSRWMEATPMLLKMKEVSLIPLAG